MIKCEDCGKKVEGDVVPYSSSIFVREDGRVAVTMTVCAPFRWGIGGAWDERGRTHSRFLRCETCHEKVELERAALVRGPERRPRPRKVKAE